MTSQQDETKESLMGDGGRKEFVLNPEDKHFTIVNERGDHNSDTHVATQALLAQESGQRSPSARGETLPQTSSGISADEILDKSDQDIGNKRKRTESPDSEIVVIDDNGERGWYHLLFSSNLTLFDSFQTNSRRIFTWIINLFDNSTKMND